VLKRQLLFNRYSALTAMLLVCAVYFCACFSVPEQHPEIAKVQEASSLNLPQLHKYTEIPQDAYFITQLTSSKKALCSIIYDGIMNFESEIRFTEPVNENELKELMWLLSYDCPELFQFSGEYAYYVRESEKEHVLSIQPHYLMTKAEYEGAVLSVEELLSAWLNETALMDDYAKEQLIYDKLIEVCTYEEDGKHSGTAYGALIEGKARCEGYSKAMCLALRKANIETMVLTGSAWDNRKPRSVRQAHAWNVANIDGSYYHLDATWDDNDQFGTCYAYFNVTDDVITKSRELDEVYSGFNLPPAAEITYNFYIQTGRYIYYGEDVSQLFREALERAYTNNSPVVLLRLETDSQAEYFSENLAKWMKEWFEQKKFSRGSYTFSVYPDSRVFCIFDIEYSSFNAAMP